MAASRVLEHSESLQVKSCPKGACLGLCEEVIVVGVTPGNYTRSKDNKSYAVRAAKLLQEEPALININPSALWERVSEGEPKAHNSQMDVVLALWKHGLISAAPGKG